jgi:hypothetical protein
VDVDFELGRSELELSGEILAEAMLGGATAGAGLLGLGQVVFDAVVGEVVERVSSPGACRPGPLGGSRVVGLGGRGGFDFEASVVEVEEMTLAGVVVEAFAAWAEDIAAKQSQGLGQFGVFFLQLAVVGGGRLEHALELIDAALGVFGLPLSVFGLPPQLVVAAQQVVEQSLALLRIVGQTW